MNLWRPISHGKPEILLGSMPDDDKKPTIEKRKKYSEIYKFKIHETCKLIEGSIEKDEKVVIQTLYAQIGKDAIWVNSGSVRRQRTKLTRFMKNYYSSIMNLNDAFIVSRQPRTKRPRIVRSRVNLPKVQKAAIIYCIKHPKIQDLCGTGKVKNWDTLFGTSKERFIHKR